MSTKPPHQVSSLAFRISGLFRISPDPSGRIMRNEPNLLPQQPKNAKRTQSQPAATPNYAKQTQFTTPRPAHDQKKCETNPISTAHSPRASCLNSTKRTQFPACPKYAKRTQFHPRRTVEDPKMAILDSSRPMR